MADLEFWKAQLTRKKAQLVELEDALSVALGEGQQYSLDTGQSRYAKSNYSLGQLRDRIADLEREIDQLHTKINGASIQGRPGW